MLLIWLAARANPGASLLLGLIVAIGALALTVAPGWIARGAGNTPAW